MNSFEWISVIGAAAWIPQILTGIYKVATKPRVSIIPVPTLEIGYNSLGPILNLKATLFAERKDATIIDMHARITHERGRVITLAWHSFTEKFSELRSQTGETAEVSRDQDATALRLSTSLPVEKFIRFQDTTFQERADALTAPALAELQRTSLLKDSGATFLQSKEHSELMRFFRQGFSWEVGHYEFELKIHLLERRKPVIARSQFQLTGSDVERLAENVEFIGTRLRQIAAGVPERERVTSSNWANPRLGSKRIMVHH
jgi:hypothetical protein